MKKVIIVIPLKEHHKLSKSEKISLHHLEHYLGAYDKCFLCPEGTRFEYHDFKIERFDRSFFGSLKAHNRFCLSDELYDRFADYEYLFMYHLDALVLDHDLQKWLEMDYDFIGPPWIKGPDLPWLKEEGVGNGGFSIRKVKTFRKLLHSNVPMETFMEKTKKILHSHNAKEFFKNILNLGTWFIPSMNSVKRHIKIYLEKKDENDDRFLYKFRDRYYPGFRVPSVETALAFGFEANPRLCYERNNHELPFGCHAWEAYDKEFWQEIVLQEIK